MSAKFAKSRNAYEVSDFEDARVAKETCDKDVGVDNVELLGGVHLVAREERKVPRFIVELSIFDFRMAANRPCRSATSHQTKFRNGIFF